MKIAVIGNTGFLGSVIVRSAAAEGHSAVGIGRSAPPPRTPGHHIQCDPASPQLIDSLLQLAPDVIVHAAGAASVADSLRDPLQDFRCSVSLWASVLDAVRATGLAPLVCFLSSAAVYGNPIELPVSEMTPVSPISPYGFHKQSCELLSSEYARCFGLRVANLRMFSVYGPSQRRLLVWELYEQLARDPGASVRLQGTGAESRDYLHEDDVGTGVLRVCAQLSGMPVTEPLTVNLASGVETRVGQLAELVAGEFGARGVIRGASHRPGDPLRWCADVTRLRQLLGTWQPRDLRTGLAECIARWRLDVG